MTNFSGVIGADGPKDPETFIATVEQARSEGRNMMILRNKGRMTGVLDASVIEVDEDEIVEQLTDESIASSVDTREPTVVGIGNFVVGRFTPMDLSEAVHNYYEANPDELDTLFRNIYVSMDAAQLDLAIGQTTPLDDIVGGDK